MLSQDIREAIIIDDHERFDAFMAKDFPQGYIDLDVSNGIVTLTILHGDTDEELDKVVCKGNGKEQALLQKLQEVPEDFQCEAESANKQLSSPGRAE